MVKTAPVDAPEPHSPPPPGALALEGGAEPGAWSLVNEKHERFCLEYLNGRFARAAV